MPLKAGYLLLIGAGGVVAYSGVKGKGVGAAFREILGGKSPSSAATANPIMGAGVAATAAAAGETPAEAEGNPATEAKNKAIGRTLATAYGWGYGSNWASLLSLWTRESGWNNYAYNSGSGATGIPQSLPYTKMPKAAWLPSQGGVASATAQIAWGLSYIKSTYGSPNAAWAHEVAQGWY